MSKLNTCIAALTIVGVSSIGVMTLPTSAQAEADSCPDSSGVLTVEEADGADVTQCDLEGRRVAEEGLSVIVPEPGESVVVEVAADDSYDGPLMLKVEVATDGTMSADPDPITPREAGGGECDQTGFAFLANTWFGRTYNWRINRSTIPSNLNEANAVSSLRDGVQNWGSLNNNCGAADDVAVSASYLGDTNLQANAGNSGGCGSSNGSNTVSFGPMSTGIQAVTCIWGNAEADIKFDDSFRQWTLSGGGNACANAYDLESVATHEFGHVLGLGHATSGSALTMWGTMPSCSNYRRTLGAGDIYAIRQKY